jgi:Mg-chelatase subunit ChlD
MSALRDRSSWSRLRAQNMVRFVAHDPSITLSISGDTSYYDGDQHAIVIAAKMFDTFSREGVLALLGHEAAHSRLSVLSWGKLTDMEKWAARFLEESRVNNYVARHFPGLSGGVREITDYALGAAIARPDYMVAAGEACAPPVFRFMASLRAHEAGLPPAPEGDESVLAAIDACQSDANEACACFPHRFPGSTDTCELDAELFLDTLQRPDGVFHHVRLLHHAWMSKRSQRQVKNHLTSELLKQQQEKAARPTAAVGSAWRDARKKGAWGRRESGSPKAYEALRVEQEPAIDRVTRGLRHALVPNVDPGLETGYPTGRAIDMRTAMAGQRDPQLLLKAWRRPFIQEERRYGLVFVADTSQSMHGAAIEALRRSTITLLEACERLRVPTSLILCGVGWRHAAKAVALVKHSDETLRTARPRISRMLVTGSLGIETPLPHALQIAHRVHVRALRRRDLVVVLTDGRATWTRRQFFAQGAQMTSTDDAGKSQGQARTVTGSTRCWVRPHEAEMGMTAALRPLIEEPEIEIIGATLGTRAALPRLIKVQRHFEDADALTLGFASLVQRSLTEMMV